MDTFQEVDFEKIAFEELNLVTMHFWLTKLSWIYYRTDCTIFESVVIGIFKNRFFAENYLVNLIKCLNEKRKISFKLHFLDIPNCTF